MTKKKKKIFISHLAEYEVVDILGKGGNCQTFKAKVLRTFPEHGKIPRGLNSGKLVVIKIPNIDPSYNYQSIRNFLQRVSNSLDQEFEATQYLRNIKQVAQVLDTGMYTQKVHRKTLSPKFIVQEFVDGQPLNDYLKDKFKSLNGFGFIREPSDFFRIAEKFSRLIRLVHQHRVIHGDIWPDNILIRNHEPVLIDFGESVFRDFGYQHLGRKEQITNAYCAPERLRGEREGRRSDIYSLGGVFYYMVTGENPPVSPRKKYKDDTLKDKIIAGTQNKNENLLKSNCGIADIISRCLRYDKDKRTSNADTLLCEIRTFSFALANESEKTSMISVVKRLKRAVETLKNKGDSFLSSLVELDLSVNASSIEDMSKGILDLAGDHETIISRLCRYLSILDKGDLFLMRSIPTLWSSQNLGINGRFLSMNKLLAQRGVKVRHLFLTTKKDYKNPEVHRIFRAHLKVVLDLQKQRCGQLKAFYRTVSKSERDELLLQGWQGAMIVRRGKVSVLEPVCDSDGKIRTIRFRSLGFNVARCKKEIIADIKNAYNLKQWFIPQA